jgi:hypothetical protein
MTWEVIPSLHWKGDWVGLHAALNMVVKKIPSCTRNQIHKYSLYGHSNICILITQDSLCEGELRSIWIYKENKLEKMFLHISP